MLFISSNSDSCLSLDLNGFLCDNYPSSLDIFADYEPLIFRISNKFEMLKKVEMP